MSMNLADILADSIKDSLGMLHSESEYLKAAEWVDQLAELADPQAESLRSVQRERDGLFEFGVPSLGFGFGGRRNLNHLLGQIRELQVDLQMMQNRDDSGVPLGSRDLYVTIPRYKFRAICKEALDSLMRKALNSTPNLLPGDTNDAA